ncbi:unnamed protein product [Orchesella dallaii]|uniref:G-protein coupled receptors family 1 profile domain-containing protein n=1 Tax=Orchesella dallaii TaxID=48710 RepID=A0ABP1PZH3_9HEXA
MIQVMEVNITINESTEVLFSYMCHLIDLPNTTKDCSISNTNMCIECPMRGGYLTGERFTEIYAFGHAVCLLLWLFTLLVSSFGILGNIVIVHVIRKHTSISKSSFDFLLFCLATADIFSCIVTAIAATCRVAYFGNWFGNGIIMIYLSYLPSAFWLCGRSLSTFLTMLITTERYIKIVFPIESQNWIIGRRTQGFALAMVLLAIFVTVPRISSVYVAPNVLYKDVPSMKHFSYVILTTSQSEFWYSTLKSVHVLIDFWLPFPYLLILNLLSLKEVLKSGKRRKEMNLKQRNNIQAVHMFLPVITVLLCCNMVPIIHFVVLQYFGMIYNEFHMMTILSMAVNSSVNFPIYYYRAEKFKMEAGSAIAELFPVTLSLIAFRDDAKTSNHGILSGIGNSSRSSNVV